LGIGDYRREDTHDASVGGWGGHHPPEFKEMDEKISRIHETYFTICDINMIENSYFILF
jgi:hypothetical protein